HRLELLRVAQLLFELLAFSDIADVTMDHLVLFYRVERPGKSPPAHRCLDAQPLLIGGQASLDNRRRPWWQHRRWMLLAQRPGYLTGRIIEVSQLAVARKLQNRVGIELDEGGQRFEQLFRTQWRHRRPW